MDIDGGHFRPHGHRGQSFWAGEEIEGGHIGQVRRLRGFILGK